MTASGCVKQAGKTPGLSRTEFAKAVFTSSGCIAELESNNRKVNDRIVRLISLAFGISGARLKTGEGRMFLKTPDEKLQRMTALFNRLPPKFQDCATVRIGQLPAAVKEGWILEICLARFRVKIYI